MIRSPLINVMVGAARKAGTLDGICLSLHGAMVTATEDDAEGALLEALRGIVGPEVPIVATLDLHANATERMARNASALVSYRTYPHIDGYERAHEATHLLARLMRRDIRPTVAIKRLPMLPPPFPMCTSIEPMLGLGKRMVEVAGRLNPAIAFRRGDMLAPDLPTGACRGSSPSIR